VQGFEQDETELDFIPKVQRLQHHGVPPAAGEDILGEKLAGGEPPALRREFGPPGFVKGQNQP